MRALIITSSAVVFDDAGRVLSIRRSGSDCWTMPHAQVGNETITAAVRRSVSEVLGAPPRDLETAAVLTTVSPSSVTYVHRTTCPRGVRHLLRSGIRVRWSWPHEAIDDLGVEERWWLRYALEPHGSDTVFSRADETADFAAVSFA